MQELIGLSACADQLQAAGKSLRCLSARQRNGWMPGDIEELGEPQCDIPNRFLRPVEIDRGRSDRECRNWDGGEQQGVVARKSRVDLPAQHFASFERACVI